MVILVLMVVVVSYSAYPRTSSTVVGVSTSIVSGGTISPSECGLAPNQAHEDRVKAHSIINSFFMTSSLLDDFFSDSLVRQESPFWQLADTLP